MLELLAPAGSMEALRAAVQNGANAVYLGCGQFNARQSAKNTTLHPKEAALAAELLLEGICEEIQQGIIVDLGPLGTLYPAVSSKWEQNGEDLKLADMTPKVNYKPSETIAATIKGASLSWATEKDEEEGTETPDDDNQGNQGTGGNTGGGGDLTP